MPLLTPLPAFPLAVAFGGTGDNGSGWTAYTPAVLAGSGSFTSASATGFYKTIGKTVFFWQEITITTLGTGAGSVRASLPLAAARGHMTVGLFVNDSKSLCCQTTTSHSSSTLYDGTFPFANGSILRITGVYEAA